MGGSRSGIVVVALGALAAASCLRTVPELPAAPNGATISGRLVEREASSGQLAPLPGVRVLAVGGTVDRSADDGRFALPALPLGTHKLVFSRPAVGIGAEPTVVKLISDITARVDGEHIALGDVEIRDPGSLHGTVSLAGSTEPSQAEGTLVAVVDTAFRGLVGRDGRYLLARIPEGGAYDVVAFRAGFVPSRLSGVSVLANKTDELSPLVLVPDGGSGSSTHVGSARLRDARAHGDIVITCTANTSTVAGASVVAHTDPEGRYTLTLPYGIHRCVWSREGYLSLVASSVAALAEGVLGLPPVELMPASTSPFPTTDRDGDGCPDATDAAPDEPDACLDSDGDGVPDAASGDDDGDGLSDAEEASPGRDGVVTDGTRSDSDGDGVADGLDVCPQAADPDQTGAACAPAEAGELVITGLTPPRVGVGMPVTLRGRGFATRADAHVVTFGGEVVTTALAVSRERLTVLVPVGARDGVVTVDNGAGVATSTSALQIVPPPIVAGFSPRRVVTGGTIVVRGERLAGARAVLGGLEAQVTSPSDGELRILVPPTRLGPQVLQIVGDGGRVELPTPVVVLGPVRIHRLDPVVVGPGQLLRIRGAGLAVEPGERVEVSFAGSSTQAVATRVTEEQVQVVVPDDARTGRITLHHPLGDIESDEPLEVSASLVVVRDLVPSIALEGEVVRLRGNNLGAVRAVRVGGAVVPIVAQTASALDVRVPVGTPAGRVVVESATGTTAAPLGLTMVRRGAVLPTGAAEIGDIAFHPQLDTLFVVTNEGTMEGDISTGRWLNTFPEPRNGGAFVEPTGRHVVFLNVFDVTVLNLRTGQTVTHAHPELVAGESLGKVLFSGDGSSAWFVAGTRLCEVQLSLPTVGYREHGSSFEAGLIATDDGASAVVGTGTGFAVIDIGSTGAERGTIRSASLTLRSTTQLDFMWPPRLTSPSSGLLPGSLLWATSFDFATGSAELQLVDPIGGGAPVKSTGFDCFHYQTSDRRFAVCWNTYGILDLESLRAEPLPLIPIGPVVVNADPRGSRFATSEGEPGDYRVVVYDLDPAPIE